MCIQLYIYKCGHALVKHMCIETKGIFYRLNINIQMDNIALNISYL